MGGGSSSEKKQEDAEEFLRANARLREQQDHLESAKVMDDKPRQQERHDMSCPQLDAKSFRPTRRISSFAESTASQKVGMFREITRRVSSLFIPLAPDYSEADLPSWDPQTSFCYPVKDIPARAKIPTKLTLADFTNVVHLADGSNANCYSALYNGQKVVIKMIKQAKERNDVTDHEFLHEHGMLARLDHPNIVKVLFLLIYLSPHVFVIHHTDACCRSPQILGAGVTPRRFLVLEHLAGGTLASVLAAHHFSFDDALVRLRELASALDYLHRFHPGATIIHRDLKVPAPLLFCLVLWLIWTMRIPVCIAAG